MIAIIAGLAASEVEGIAGMCSVSGSLMGKNRNITKGVNLGGWLSQCDHTPERYETFITEADFRTVKEWGLDHVRIPVDYDLVEEKDGTYKEEGFAILQRAIDWCGKYGLNMILDLHKTMGYSFDDAHGEAGFFDSEKLQERFYTLWERVAERFGKYEDRLAFFSADDGGRDISVGKVVGILTATCRHVPGTVEGLCIHRHQSLEPVAAVDVEHLAYRAEAVCRVRISPVFLVEGQSPAVPVFIPEGVEIVAVRSFGVDHLSE